VTQCSANSATSVFVSIILLILTPNGLRYWRWGGVDAAWEQIKLEARKMLAVSAARREATVPSISAFVRYFVLFKARR